MNLERHLVTWRDSLPKAISCMITLGHRMSPHTTLGVGGPADLFANISNRQDLAELVLRAQIDGVKYTLIGGGSNVCISDHGIRGLVIHNRAEEMSFGDTIDVDTGCQLMALFRQTALRGLGGLEFAVGIPGTVGGALASNAGAYRQNISDIVESVDVVEGGRRKTEPSNWMEFRYRDSRLRQPQCIQPVVLGVNCKLQQRSRRVIMERARDNQRQRIFKQPWLPSAGSFFKNVVDQELADNLNNLPEPLRTKGIIPAGFLSAACDCKGLRVGNAMISRRHGNFVVNAGGASAADIRSLTETVKARVFDRFGITLIEEVLFVGDWPDGDWRQIAE